MNQNNHPGIFPGIYHWDDNETNCNGLDQATLSYLTNNMTFEDTTPDKESSILIQASNASPVIPDSRYPFDDLSEDSLNISAESGSVSFMTGLVQESKKNVDKGTEEYKKRRERNNVAVRKSREKAKQRSKDTELKVVELQNENINLKRKVDQLGDQMVILRRLLDNAGVSRERVDNEIAGLLITPSTSSYNRTPSPILHPLLNS